MIHKSIKEAKKIWEGFLNIKNVLATQKSAVKNQNDSKILKKMRKSIFGLTLPDSKKKEVYKQYIIFWRILVSFSD